MNLLISVRSEMLKTKRTASFYFTLAAAAFGPFMSLLDILVGEGLSPAAGKDIFNRLFIQKFQMTSLVAFPMFLILTCTLLSQIEYRNNAWKQVFASPQTKGNVFFAKFITVHFLILAFLVTNVLLMFACAVILHFREPSVQVLHQPLNGYDILMSRVNTYVALLAICALQFWLGLKFKNFIVSIAIGIVCWLAGTLLVMPIESGFAAYFPYSFPAFISLPKFNSQLSAIYWTSAGYAALFLILGFWDFTRRKVKS